MKHNALILSISALIFGFIFTSCQKDEYLDWKYLNESWLEEHRDDEGWITEPSGLQYKVIIPGILGESPSDVSYVYGNYTNFYINGDTLFSSQFRGHLSEYVPGFRDVIKKMRVNSRYQVRIPYDLAYGKEGTSPIPPYTTLIFHIELTGFFNSAQ